MITIIATDVSEVYDLKERIISGLIIAFILLGSLFTLNTVFFPILMAAVCGIAVYELNNVAKVKLPIEIVSIAVGAYIPFEIRYGLLEKIHITPFAALTVYVIAMLIMMIKWHGEVHFDQVAISIFSSLAVPMALGCWIRINDLQLVYDKYDKFIVLYLMLFVISCAWLSDIFAYFTGVFFGKHKMTPVVSPKKTWEGAIGGIVITAALNVGLFFFFDKNFFEEGLFLWNWYAVIPISMALSVISIFGDLSASVIKRHYGVKDYGWLIPGHGGIMDRFDSMLFVFPVMYAFLSVANTFAF